MASYDFVNSSAKSVVCEGSSYCKIFLIHPMYGKILMNIDLLELCQPFKKG